MKIQEIASSPIEDLYENVWDVISLYSHNATYTELDNIYHYLEEGGDIPKAWEGRTREEMKEYYEREFPIMMGNALKEYFEDIANGVIDYEIIWEK